MIAGCGLWPRTSSSLSTDLVIGSMRWLLPFRPKDDSSLPRTRGRIQAPRAWTGRLMSNHCKRNARERGSLPLGGGGLADLRARASPRYQYQGRLEGVVSGEHLEHGLVVL